MSTSKTFLQTMKNFHKKIKTLNYVNQAIDIDLNRLSKKAKEYESMFQRSNNLKIAVMTTQIKKSQAILNELGQLDSQLRDPASGEAQQPEYAQNKYRSVKPEIFLAVGICTHLGCSPTYLPDSFSEQVQGVSSGFFCPCHGSKFDMAGRVFQGVPAPLNLVVPPHMFLSDTRILVGKDEGDV